MAFSIAERIHMLVEHYISFIGQEGLRQRLNHLTYTITTHALFHAVYYQGKLLFINSVKFFVDAFQLLQLFG